MPKEDTRGRGWGSWPFSPTQNLQRRPGVLVHSLLGWDLGCFQAGLIMPESTGLCLAQQRAHRAALQAQRCGWGALSLPAWGASFFLPRQEH